MSDNPSERYRRLATQCLEVANTFQPSRQRSALLQMAQVWQRLADQYEGSTPPFSLSAAAAEQPVMQQQQQVQPKNENEDKSLADFERHGIPKSVFL
jgi:hypothetical protein